MFNFRQLRMTFFHKIIVTEKNNFPSNVQHNFAKGKVISTCKNDKHYFCKKSIFTQK